MIPRAERSFVLWVAAASLTVPGSLLLLRPFDEPGVELAVGAGWGLAMLVIVPSFFLMARVMGSDDALRFQRAFMFGIMGRFGVSILGVLAFATLLEQPPLWTFLLSFFLGYALLSGLEMVLLLKKTPERTHA